MILDYSGGGVNGITTVPISGRENSESRFKDTRLLALKVEKGAVSQGMRAADKSWKSQRTEFSFRASGRNIALLIP